MTEKNLNKLENSLNFYVPKKNVRGNYGQNSKRVLSISRYCKREHEKPTYTDIRVCVLSIGLVQLIREKYSDFTTTETTLRTPPSKMDVHPIAFSLSGGQENFIILNPSNNVPHLKAKLRKNGSKEIMNSAFVDDIFKAFHVDKLKIRTIILELEFFATIQKMDLYRLKLIEEKEI